MNTLSVPQSSQSQLSSYVQRIDAEIPHDLRILVQQALLAGFQIMYSGEIALAAMCIRHSGDFPRVAEEILNKAMASLKDDGYFSDRKTSVPSYVQRLIGLEVADFMVRSGSWQVDHDLIEYISGSGRSIH